MKKLIGQGLGIKGLLLLVMLLVMAVASVDAPANVSAHGGDASLVHACVNQTTLETLIVHPSPSGGPDIDCVSRPWPFGPGWAPVDLDNDWSGAGTGSLFPANLTDNVGIGTAIPTEALDVVGNVHVSGSFIAGATTTYSDGSITLSAGTDLNIDSDTLFVDNANNRVGVGTAIPSSNLEVSGNVELTNLFDNDGSNFFDGACGDNQHITDITTDGAITCAADSGDISGVTAGTGLSGGGINGTVTLNADTTFLQQRVAETCAAGSSIRVINLDGTVSCETDTDTTFDGTDFALSNQACAVGEVVTGVDISGNVTCAIDSVNGGGIGGSGTANQLAKFTGAATIGDSGIFEDAMGKVGIGTTEPQSALQVNGYTQLGLTSGFPPPADCDEASEGGRIKADSVLSKLYVCFASGWGALSPFSGGAGFTSTRVVSESFSILSLALTTVTVFCDDDEWLTGGGYAENPSNAIFPSLAAREDSPLTAESGLANGWSVTVFNGAPETSVIDVFAICTS